MCLLGDERGRGWGVAARERGHIFICPGRYIHVAHANANKMDETLER